MKLLLKILLVLFIIFVVLPVIIGVLILGYLGFVPGVSALMGTNKPRDLGVRYTQEDLTHAQKKLNQKIVEPKSDPYKQFISAGGSPVNVMLTQEEYSAHLESIHPISNVQIKLNGSSFEMSGRIDKKRIPQFIRTWGLADVSDAEVLDVVNKYLPVDPIIYFAGTGGAKNNKITIKLTKAELGRLPIPIDQAQEILVQYSEGLFKQIPGFSVEDSEIENGQLHFKGSAVKEVPKY